MSSLSGFAISIFLIFFNSPFPLDSTIEISQEYLSSGSSVTSFSLVVFSITLSASSGWPKEQITLPFSLLLRQPPFGWKPSCFRAVLPVRWGRDCPLRSSFWLPFYSPCWPSVHPRSRFFVILWPVLMDSNPLERRSGCFLFRKVDGQWRIE